MDIIKKRSNIISRIFGNFTEKGWPPTILVVGYQYQTKINFVWNAIQQELFKQSLRGDRNLSDIKYLSSAGEHPDCYVFPNADISIGSNNSSVEEKTVRHLLHHFIPYAPRESKIRFVIFENAARIRDQAESALLKILEEPPKHTHFILCSQNPYDIKDTIRSRCFIIPFVEKYETQKVPSEPWKRFWFFSGQENSLEYHLICKIQWDEQIKNLYDHLSYTSKDFLILDSLGPDNVKKNFPKIPLDTRNKIVILNLLPLYFSLRDALFEGQIPTIGPIRIATLKTSYCYATLINLRKLFISLREKYFQTRPVNPLPCYYEFVNKFMNYWIFKN